MTTVTQTDWPVHRPRAWDAPIPGTHWYAGCEPGGDWDYELGNYRGTGPRVNPATGICTGCGESACIVCGRESCPDHPVAAARALLPVDYLRDGVRVIIAAGDLAGDAGYVESSTYTHLSYQHDASSSRTYWVIIDGDHTPVPFLRGQLLSLDEVAA